MATDNTATAELYGPTPKSKFYGYWRKDWIDLCEDLKDRDRTVYGVLRSLVFEDRRRDIRNDVRVLTLAALCALIPGVNGKPTTLGGLRDSLRRLSKVGAISDPDGNPFTTSSSKNTASKPLRIRIHDVPCNGYQPRWRSSEEKLKAIQAGWNPNQDESAGWDSNQSGCDPNQPGWDSNQSGWDSNHDSEPEQGKRDSLPPSSRAITPPPSPRTPDREAPSESSVARIGEGGVATQKDQGGTGLLDHSLAAVSLAAELPRGTGIETGKLVSAITRRLNEGLALEVVRRELLKPLPHKVRSLTGLYLGRLAALTGNEPAQSQSTAVAPRPDAHTYVDRYGSCDTCGLVEDNPRHRVLTAAKTA